MFRTLSRVAALALVAGTLVLVPAVARAATLSFSPSSGTLAPGQTIVVRIVAASPQEALNAISGAVELSGGALTIASITKASSVLNFWLEDPVSSPTAAQFGGVALGGYQGTAGVAATLTLRAQAVGTGKLSFSTGSVLANDGKGTEILTGTTDATFTVAAGATPAKPAAAEEPVVGGGTTSAFVINSATHPQQSAWYKATTGTFSWELPPGATATRLLLDRSPSSVPTKVYTTPLATKTIDGLPLGTSYLHVQHKVGGEWGGVGHFKINIDTTPPRQFTIQFPHGATSISPQPVVFFNTTDSDSGIDHYEVKVGTGGPLATAAPADSNPYTLPPQEPGTYVVVVTAFDRAGNTTSDEAEFTIEGIDAPVITNYPEELTVGDIMRVRGTTYANATVRVTVYDEGRPVVTEETKSNSLGDFGVVVSKRLWAGTYTITARVTDDRGARSVESEPKTVTVRLHLFTDVFAFVANYTLITLTLLAAIVGIAAAGIWSWFKLHTLLRTLRQESAEADSILHKSFALLRKDLATHTRRLRRARLNRDLSNEELDFLEQFDNDLSEAEQLIGGEIADLAPKKKKRQHRTKAPDAE